MSVKNRVHAQQGSTVELKVHASGYPTPMASDIIWWWPNDTTITENNRAVEFQNDRKTLKLTDVQPQQSGHYKCTVSSSTADVEAVTEILLEVFGMFYSTVSM